MIGLSAWMVTRQRRNDIPAGPDNNSNGAVPEISGAKNQDTASAPLNVQIKSKGETVWIRIRADENSSTEVMLNPNEAREFTPERRLIIHYSRAKASALDVTINGSPAVIPTTGESSLIEMVITKDNYTQYIKSGGAPSNNAPGGENLSQSNNSNTRIINQNSTPAPYSTPTPSPAPPSPEPSTDKDERLGATITSDEPLNEYSAYRSGNRFYVVIPGLANGSQRRLTPIRKIGNIPVEMQKRGNDTVYVFQLPPGKSAHVNQRFNRLEVIIR
jgi:hypothetical protein